MSNALALQKWEERKWKPGDPRAADAARKAVKVRMENARIARGLQSPHPVSNAARLNQLRRMQRALLTRLDSVGASLILDTAKAVRELFEIEQELLGRRPLKAGKVPRQANAEQARRALQLPDVASLPRPDGLDTAPDGYDPHAGLPPLNTGAAQKHLAEAQAQPQAPPGATNEPAERQQTKGISFSPPTVPAPPTPGPAPTR